MTQQFLPWSLSSFRLNVYTSIVCYSHHSLAYSTGYVFSVTEGVSVSSLTGLDAGRWPPSEGTERHPVEPREVTIVREGVRVSTASRLGYSCSLECVCASRDWF